MIVSILWVIPLLFEKMLVFIVALQVVYTFGSYWVNIILFIIRFILERIVIINFVFKNLKNFLPFRKLSMAQYLIVFLHLYLHLFKGENHTVQGWSVFSFKLNTLIKNTYQVPTINYWILLIAQYFEEPSYRSLYQWSTQWFVFELERTEIMDYFFQKLKRSLWLKGLNTIIFQTL